MKKRGLTALAVGALIVVTVVAVAVLASNRTNDDTTARRRIGPLPASLCAIRRAAAGGDVAEARRVFADRAHHALHDLAATTGEHDRAGAARLLEAKEAVEGGLAQASPQLVRDLDRLIAATTRASGQAGNATCPDREES